MHFLALRSARSTMYERAELVLAVVCRCAVQLMVTRTFMRVWCWSTWSSLRRCHIVEQQIKLVPDAQHQILGLDSSVALSLSL